jgi:hypothetical protein
MPIPYEYLRKIRMSPIYSISGLKCLMPILPLRSMLRKLFICRQDANLTDFKITRSACINRESSATFQRSWWVAVVHRRIPSPALGSQSIASRLKSLQRFS